MKKRLLFFCMIVFSGSLKLSGQVYINDDFSTWPQGWTFYGTPCAGQYSGMHDTMTGMSGASAKIDKSDCNSPCTNTMQAGYSKSIAFTSPATSIDFSVDFRAMSNTSISTVTNAWARIYDHTNNAWLLSQCLVCGGTTDSGWQSYATSVSIPCPGTDSVTVYLFTGEAWSGTPWCRNAWFDNPRLEVTNSGSALSLVTMTQIDASCNGGPDGSITVGGSGGTLPYTFQWDAAAGSQTGPTANNLSAGTYTVTITDANGCTTSQSYTISEPLQLQVSASAIPGCTSGSVDATVNGGTTPYTYSWNTNPVQTTQTATGLTTGTFTVTVTDANGCTAQDSASYTQAPPLNLSVSTTLSGCTSADGTATVNVTGGSGGYTYQWNTSPAQAGSTATGLPAGTYTVTVTDLAGCTSAMQATVQQAASVSVSIQNSSTGCNQELLSATVSGGTPGYAYKWNTVPPQSGPDITVVSSGTFTVTITDSAGCTAIDSVQVIMPDPLIASVTQSGSTCSDATLQAVVTGGSGAYSYSWNSVPPQSGPGLVVNTSGTYSVVVTDANGCTATGSATVNIPAQLSATIAYESFSCADATLKVTVTGGTAGYTYTWNTNPPQSGQRVTVSSSGSYSVTVTDASGCTTSENFTAIVPEPLSAHINSTPTACNENTLEAEVAGGTGQFVYSWNTGQVSSSPELTNALPGNYTVMISDSLGCTVSASVIIPLNTPPVATILAEDTIVRLGKSTWLYASGGDHYVWHATSGISCTTCNATLLTPVETGTYCVTVSDQNFCSSEACIDIKVNAEGCEGLFLPSAFTPNNDGLNDIFCVYGVMDCIESYKLILYNRWGEEIYTSSDPAVCWDGYYKGQPVNETIMSYRLDIKFFQEETKVRHGAITVLR